MATILDFRSARFYLFLIYKSSRCFLLSLESIGLSIQEKKQKIDFQDGGHGGHLGFPIGTILAIFVLQVIPLLLFIPLFLFYKSSRYFCFTSHPLPLGIWVGLRFVFVALPGLFSYLFSYQVSSQLAQGCRRSRLLKQLLTLHDGRRTTDDGWRTTDDRHWLTTIAHHEHFVLRWANKSSLRASVLRRHSFVKGSELKSFCWKALG